MFYQMCAGMDAQQKQSLKLESADSFKFINGCVENDMDDREEYRRLLDALAVLNFDSQQQSSVFSVLSGILWLGQIEFKLGKPQKDPRNPLVTLPAPVVIANPLAVQTAARLLGLDPKKLSENLERRTVQATGREVS